MLDKLLTINNIDIIIGMLSLYSEQISYVDLKKSIDKNYHRFYNVTSFGDVIPTLKLLKNKNYNIGLALINLGKLGIQNYIDFNISCICFKILSIIYSLILFLGLFVGWVFLNLYFFQIKICF